MPNQLLLSKVRTTCELARNHALSIVHSDGHWCGIICSNVTTTVEHLFLYKSLGQEPPGGHVPYTRYLFSEQNQDGSWGLAPDYPGDVSTSCEAYFALRLCGVPSSDPKMCQARTFILSVGGISKVRMFTRLFLAMLGIIPWSSVPYLPAEVILLPTWFRLNVYKLSSWARSTIIPLLLVRHHEPVYALPKHMQDTKLNELWMDSNPIAMPYALSLRHMYRQGIAALLFGIGDRVLNLLHGLKYCGLRDLARRKCLAWIIEHQEPEGDWAGIAMPMLCSIQALLLEGYSQDAPEVVRGLSALERFTAEDERGKRLQACVSPHWDTVLMMTALCDASLGCPPPKILDDSAV